MPVKDTKQFDEEPVVYCAHCYSLKIQYEDAVGADYCMDCGSSDTRESTIEQWESLYERRYGHKYAVKGNDVKKSPIFKLTIGKLKDKVFKCADWQGIIHDVYPRFPADLEKTDAILYFFDKAIKDNKLDGLRISLIKHI